LHTLGSFRPSRVPIQVQFLVPTNISVCIAFIDKTRRCLAPKTPRRVGPFTLGIAGFVQRCRKQQTTSSPHFRGLRQQISKFRPCPFPFANSDFCYIPLNVCPARFAISRRTAKRGATGTGPQRGAQPTSFPASPFVGHLPPAHLFEQTPPPKQQQLVSAPLFATPRFCFVNSPPQIKQPTFWPLLVTIPETGGDARAFLC